jgi:Asp-tRNA(Asn)/Glu-tRNA(Gln) amidotransferase A subunit family amidase
MLADGALTAPELLEIYLEPIARLDSQLRCYRVVLTDNARDEAYAGPVRRRIVWTPVSGCRCSACRSRSKMMSTSPAR